MTKPQPLDLEEFKDWIEKKEEEIYEKEGYIDDVYLNEQIIKEIKQRLKSACEFYLRYEDKPKLLIEEQSFLKKMMEDLEMIKTDPNYNSWLFKLAFKDVLKEEK